MVNSGFEKVNKLNDSRKITGLSVKHNVVIFCPTTIMLTKRMVRQENQSFLNRTENQMRKNFLLR